MPFRPPSNKKFKPSPFKKKGTARDLRIATAYEDWPSIRRKVIARDGGKCQRKIGGVKCLKPFTDVHHIIHASKGGRATMANLMCVCRGCHAALRPHNKYLK